jgi:hypothetical protein
MRLAVSVAFDPNEKGTLPTQARSTLRTGETNMHITNPLIISAVALCFSAYTAALLYGAHLQSVGINPFS